MTLTFSHSKTGEVYGSFTASGRNGLFTHKEKMKIATLRIKLLAKFGADVVDVMVVMDAEGVRTAERMLAIPSRFTDPAYKACERSVARSERSIRKAVR